MSISWPSTVNSYILTDNYLPYQGSNVMITTPENGPVQMRCRYTAVSWFHPVTLKLNPAEYAAFITFVETTLRYGTLSFYFDLPSRTAPLTTASRLCRFSFGEKDSPYKTTKIIADEWFYVTFVLEEFAQ